VFCAEADDTKQRKKHETNNLVNSAS